MAPTLLIFLCGPLQLRHPRGQVSVRSRNRLFMSSSRDPNVHFSLSTVTEEKLQLAQEHIESLEQQLADTEKKVIEANRKGIYL